MDVDVLKARLFRQDVRQSWGFIMQGGLEYHQPISIATIAPASPAANIGLRVGDVIVEIENVSTVSITGQQALDLTEVLTGTLRMTVERRVNGDDQVDISVKMNEISNTSIHMDTSKMHANHCGHKKISAKQSHPLESDFRTVHARLFEFKEKHVSNATAPHSSTSYSYFHQPVLQRQCSMQYQQENVANGIASPQSRTFKILQKVLHENESSAGVNGLPPPRSATLENLKSQKQRVRVMMPQQYNSPMGMYSAHNVLETFTAQAESMLDSPNRSCH